MTMISVIFENLYNIWHSFDCITMIFLQENDNNLYNCPIFVTKK